MTERNTLGVHGPTISQDVVIINEHGLHARPVMQFVDLANRFSSDIQVAKGEQVVDGKSPMEVMLLEAHRGTRLRLLAQGVDAEEAVAALAELVGKGFTES
ncbi:MAG: Multiphosphoryl transfer protein [Phycisphaerae bacterium]|nr:Multiphosphoryl transfer protein [Phycisphaerae bacterium]